MIWHLERTYLRAKLKDIVVNIYLVKYETNMIEELYDKIKIIQYSEIRKYSMLY